MSDSKSDSEECLREDFFTVHYPESSPVKCKVTLTSTELFLEEQDDESERDIDQEKYKIDDIFGFHIVKKDNEEPSLPTVYACIIFYTHSTESNGSRVRVPRIFEINQPKHSYEANLDVAKSWAVEIGNLVQAKFPNLHRHRLQNNYKPSDSPSLREKIEKAIDFLKTTRNNAQDSEQSESNSSNAIGKDLNLAFYDESFTLCKTLLFERKFLMILNPVSGQGKGLILLQEKILPVFADSGILTHLETTEYSSHASNIIKKFDLSSINGIVSIGGDGLLNEIVNGVRSRPDSQKFADIPIGVVATGSGNGLARSISAYYEGSKEYRSNPVLYSTLSVARGCVGPVNLTEVSLNKRKFYSFLSVGWGLLSDIDIESEVLRYIGEIRFFIWSFIRLFQLRRYKAELSYVPHDAKGSISSRVIVNDDFVSVYSACQSHIGSDMLFAPDAKPFDSIIHLTYLPSSTGRLAAAKFLAALNSDQGQHISVDPVKYVKVKEFTIRCEGGIEGCLTVDGEQVKGEEITVKMSDTPLFVFTMG